MEQKHIGDGVYISFDGHHINIAVNDHRNHVVALDPSVVCALERYIAEVRNHCRQQQANIDATP